MEVTWMVFHLVISALNSGNLDKTLFTALPSRMNPSVKELRPKASFVEPSFKFVVSRTVAVLNECVTLI